MQVLRRIFLWQVLPLSSLRMICSARLPRELPTMLDYRTTLKGQYVQYSPVVPIYTLMENLRWLKANGGGRLLTSVLTNVQEVLYAEIDRNKLFKGTVEEASRSLMNICFVMNDEYKGVGEAIPRLRYRAWHGRCQGIKGHRSVGGFRKPAATMQDHGGVQALVKAMQDFEAQH